MSAETISLLAFLLVLQTGSSIQIARSTDRHGLTNRSWSSVLQEVESTLRANCGDECVQVLHAYFPPGHGLQNATSEEIWGPCLEKIAQEGARQARA